MHSTIDCTLNLHINQKNNRWIICDPTLKDEVEEQWFEQKYWMNQGRLLGASSGRGAAWIIKSEWGKWILRHYFRGGLYAKFNKDQYLWTGIKNTRAYREFQLLAQIQNCGLPSPKPMAALVVKKGLYYRNDLIMEHLKHERTLAQSLLADPLPLEQWQRIGALIAQYHQQGIYHSDLNAHNILLDEAQIHLIDFDKGSQKPPNKSWQQSNLQRLQRSIEKVSGQSCEKEMSAAWQALINGYQS